MEKPDKVVKKCSNCREPGHTKNKCPIPIVVKEKKPKEKKSHIERRLKDAEYYQILDVVDKLERDNIPFTDEDKKKKQEIFGVPDMKTCLITGQGNVQKGDHIYAVREYYKVTNCYGGNSEWNTAPVTSSKNKGYKVFNHLKDFGWKKDIGYQTLTDEEFSQCTEQEKMIYTKIKSWKDYAKSRGAKICWKLSERTDRELREIAHRNQLQLHLETQAVEIELEKD